MHHIEGETWHFRRYCRWLERANILENRLNHLNKTDIPRTDKYLETLTHKLRNTLFKHYLIGLKYGYLTVFEDIKVVYECLQQVGLGEVSRRSNGDGRASNRQPDEDYPHLA